MTTTIAEAEFQNAVAAAVRAPSMHNSQPWRFRRNTAGGIDVLADPARMLPAADPTGWGMRIACGAAILNLRLALAAAGTPALVQLRPDRDQPQLMARLTPGPARPGTPAEMALYVAIGRRHSNRGPFADQPVPTDVLARLQRAATDEGAELELMIGPESVGNVAEIIDAADRTVNTDPAYRAELAAWTRTTAHPDGVPAEAGGPSPDPGRLFPRRPFGQRPLPAHRGAEPDPLVAVIATTGDTANDQLLAGQALQKVLLTITDAGLAVSMLSQPIEVATAREQLSRLLSHAGTPQIVLRIGYGIAGTATPRRPVTEVIDQ